MSTMRILTFTVVLLSMCLFLRCSAGNSRLAGRRLPCCTKVSTENITHDVIGDTYRLQSAKLPCVKAVIFATQSGKICVDPRAEWVKELIDNMRKL